LRQNTNYNYLILIYIINMECNTNKETCYINNVNETESFNCFQNLHLKESLLKGNNNIYT
jgi:hypothetical protein